MTNLFERQLFAKLKSKNLEFNNINTVYLVSHSADLDGWASGVVARRYFETEFIKHLDHELNLVSLGYNYQDKVDYDIEDGSDLSMKVTNQDIVIFMDCSLQSAEVLLHYNKITNLFIIDHHQTSIDIIKTVVDEHPISGIRETERAGCELTYLFFFIDISTATYNISDETPMALKLLGGYDRWDHSGSCVSWDILIAFQWGMRSVEGLLTDDVFSGPDEVKDLMFLCTRVIDDDPLMYNIYTSGKAIVNFIKNRNRSVVKDTGFECRMAIERIDDEVMKIYDYKCFCASDYRNNSALFEDGLIPEEYEKYDVFIMAHPNIRKDSHKITLSTNRTDINIGELCTKLKGGGHMKVGAFTAIIRMYRSRRINNKIPIMCFEEIEPIKYNNLIGPPPK